MNPQVSRKKQIMGLLFGLVAGLAFSVMAWGVDAFLLSQSHVTFSWVKFVPGLLICLPAGSLVGWLSIRIERVWAALLLWALLACLFVWLTMWLPLQCAPAIMLFIDPKLSDVLYYPVINNEYQFKIIGMAVIGFVSLICGLMEIHLIDQSLLSTAALSLISPVLVSLALFGVAGNTADYMMNRLFREPLQIMDNLIQYAIDNEGKELSPIIARQKRLTVIKDLDGLIYRPRTLTLIAFDKTLGQIDILVNFDGRLARCSVIYNQPTICKRAKIKLGEPRYASQWGPPVSLFSY